MPNITPGLVSAGISTSTTTCATVGGTTQASGSTFVAHVATIAASPPGMSVADTYNVTGNWLRIGSQLNDGNNGYLDRFYVTSASGGGSDVLTATATGVTPTSWFITLTELLNPGTSPLDLSNTSGVGPFIQPVSSGSISPAAVPGTGEYLLSYVMAQYGTAPLTISGVTITGTAGQFSCTSSTIAVNNLVTISGTFGGTGSITGYVNPTIYLVSATNGSTTFTLTTLAGVALVTTAGTPTGLTYTVAQESEANGFTILEPGINISGLYAALGGKFVSSNGTYSASWTIGSAGGNLFCCSVIDSFKGGGAPNSTSIAWVT